MIGQSDSKYVLLSMSGRACQDDSFVNSVCTLARVVSDFFAEATNSMPRARREACSCCLLSLTESYSANSSDNLQSDFSSLSAAHASVARKYCYSQVLLVQEAADSTLTFLQTNMKCDVFVHIELYAKSFCQVARSFFKGILKAHRHSLCCCTNQMLAQLDLLRYWFAETARCQTRCSHSLIC